MKSWLPALMLVIAALMVGCATVEPWERETLTRRVMRPVMCPESAAFEGHVHTTREAVRGATVSEGISCGCN